VLLLGRGGAGKTSTLNSLLGERCGAPSALQPSVSGPAAYTRRVAIGPDAEFAITVIDTPTIVAQDIISNQACPRPHPRPRPQRPRSRPVGVARLGRLCH
jgi:GTPase SAR1 family protein